MASERNVEVLNELFEDLNINYNNSHDNLTFDYSKYYLSKLMEFRYSYNESAYECLQSFFVGFLSSGKITCAYYHVLMDALNDEYFALYVHRQVELLSMKNSILDKYEVQYAE